MLPAKFALLFHQAPRLFPFHHALMTIVFGGKNPRCMPYPLIALLRTKRFDPRIVT